MAALLTLAAVAQGQDFVNREPALKAAYLAKFGNYTTWPAAAFADEKSPLIIGTLGQSPVAAPLQEIGKRNLVVQKRSLAVRVAARAEDLAGCHIVYLPASLSPKQRAEALRAVQGRHVLIVGEDATFLADGGVLQFVVEGNRLTGSVSQKAFQREGLKVSSELLTIFRPVD